jgi:hypothetical protein
MDAFVKVRMQQLPELMTLFQAVNEGGTGEANEQRYQA